MNILEEIRPVPLSGELGEVVEVLDSLRCLITKKVKRIRVIFLL